MKNWKCSFLVFAVVTLFSGGATAKCSMLLIEVRGEVSNNYSDKMEVDLTSEPIAGWKNPSLTVKDQRFQGVFLFDTTSSFRAGSEREDCVRRPKSLQVSLVSSGHTIKSIRLNFPHDFREAKPGEFVLRKEIGFR